MHPRSAVLAKKGLPTIEEGYEEQVEDINQLNGLIHPRQACKETYNTEDYLQSICHLARPTFPLPEFNILTVRSPDITELNPRLSRFSKSAHVLAPVAQVRRHAVEKKGNQVGSNMHLNTSEVSDATSERSQHFANPLEYLYRHDDAFTSISQDDQGSSRGSEAGGSECNQGPCTQTNVLNLCCLQSTCCKKTCPELCLQEPSSKGHGHFQTQSLPAKQRKSLKNKQPVQRYESKMCDSKISRSEMFGTCRDKNFMITHWIEDCWSAWKETRVQAYMLPAIAEI